MLNSYYGNHCKNCDLHTYTCTARARFPLSNRDSNTSVVSSWDLSILMAHCSGPALIPPTLDLTNWKYAYYKRFKFERYNECSNKICCCRPYQKCILKVHFSHPVRHCSTATAMTSRDRSGPFLTLRTIAGVQCPLYKFEYRMVVNNM